MRRFAFTLDLESDYSGTLIEQYAIFRKPAAIKNLLLALEGFGVKLTVFCVGQVLERFPEVVKILEHHNCEFQVHGYSHNLKEPDSEREIAQAKSSYYNYFCTNPTGYRAPQGRISKAGLTRLERHGFLYDSSIFPSVLPNPFRHLLKNRHTHRVHDSNLVEIPLTSVTPFRLPFSALTVKLFGFQFYKALFRVFGTPHCIIYNSHLHDFIICKESYSRLPFHWRWVNHRNKHDGLGQTVRLLTYMREQGYHFCYMSEIFESFHSSQVTTSGNEQGSPIDATFVDGSAKFFTTKNEEFGLDHRELAL